LCQLARVESQLRARLRPEEAGLPRLAVGQQVRLFFDAFPYQRYGTVTGQLEWISPAAAITSEGQSFAARAILDQTAFTSRGKNRPLEAGMKGEARIRVGSRTAAEYAFEPLRQLREQTRSE
jgi:multidrug efflux pump subunit AcrA (membrane-fusion protein)